MARSGNRKESRNHRQRRNKRSRILQKESELYCSQQTALSALTAISTDSTHPRVLRKSARKYLDKTRATFLYIMPWVNDVEEGLAATNRPYKQTSLLGLPVELRQMIFEKTMDRSPRGENWWWGREQVGQWIGNLSSVCGIMQQDMTYVGHKWKKAKIDEEEQQAASVPQPHDYRPTGAKALADILKSTKEAPVAKGREWQKVGRPGKCWKCTQRHYHEDTLCPIKRRDPVYWNSVTRAAKSKRKVFENNGMFQGTKIIFDE